ncbi:MAG: bifunctional hydroxymethylpyrimidine kinase/phosphomethylpyrimidine kinase [Proteobacteria bacterium]|nr:bifunctional hydroxymethylpyrimidine kinase/phosphomethylpyrimidine kinase [Pseudomonadota bacterium]
MNLKKKGMNRPKRLLIIAGSDPTAGAGVQADLKTASAIGVYGLTVITSITAQNTKGVQGVFNLSDEYVESQLNSILEDVEFDGIKIGMIGEDRIAKVIEKFIKKQKKIIVLDPVLVAQSGGILANKKYIESLFPFCDLITPNAFEAEKLAGIKIKTLNDVLKAGKELLKKAKRVLIKGGDSKIDFDIYFESNLIHKFPIERLDTKNTHGTGCSLATAIASYLILGFDYVSAISKARELIYKALQNGLELGSQFGTIDQFATLKEDAKRYEIIEHLKLAFESIKNENIGYLVPEIQTNFVYALPNAKNYRDVAGFPGRIINFKGNLCALSSPEFGASKHVASLVLSAKRFYPEISSAIALRYIPELIPLLKKAGLRVSNFDRKKEPKNIKEKEGSSLDWGVSEALKNTSVMPDIIYDLGDVGKEPVIRVFGNNPFEVVEKVIKIKKIWESKNVRVSKD